jgi:hypothetical protein
MIDVEMKVRNSNVPETEETIAVSEKIVNVQDVQKMAGKRRNSATNLQLPKFTSKTLRRVPAGTMMIWPHQKVGKEIKPRDENVAIRPTVARQSAVTEEEDLIGRKEEIDDHPTGLNAAILIGLKEETDEATIDLNDEVPTYPNAVNGSPILITSKFVLN